jgi:hypothetical protein
MSSADEASELREQASLCAPHSGERVDMLERAARLADSASDTKLGYAIRDDLIDAAVFSGEPQRAMVAFAWCLALCDERPDEFPESNLHWKYKWMALFIPDFPEISRQQVNALLDDLEARFRRRGEGESAVLKLRAQAASKLGEDADLARYFAAWKRAPRDSLSDCLACELSEEVGLLIRLGRNDDAVDKMQRLLRGRQRCLEVPAITYAVVQLALLRQHDLATAMAYHRRGYPLLKRLRKEGAPLVGDHLAVLAVANEAGRGLRILRESMALAAEHSAGLSRLRFLVGAQVLLQRASKGQEKATLAVPKAFGGSGGNEQQLLASVAELLAEHARALASAFDRRNGTAGMSQWAEERLGLAALELPPLVNP